MRQLALCLLVIVAAPAFGQVKSEISPGRTVVGTREVGEKSLAKLGELMLMDPKVQVELGLTQKQLAVGWLRTSVLPAVRMMKAEKSENPLESLMESDPISFQQGLRLSDLTPTQRARLNELAVQSTPLQAMETEEISSKLKLSKVQKEKLAAISREVDAAFVTTLMASPAVSSLQQTLQGLQKTIEEKGVNEMTAEELEAMMEKAIVALADFMGALEKSHMPIYRKAQADAVKLLTPAQSKQLKKLGGKKAAI